MISAPFYPLLLRFPVSWIPEIFWNLVRAKWLISWQLSCLSLSHVFKFDLPLFQIEENLPFFLNPFSAFIYCGSCYRMLNIISSIMYDFSGSCSHIWESDLSWGQGGCNISICPLHLGSVSICLNDFSKLCLKDI